MFKKFILSCFILFLFTNTGICRTDYDYVNISNPFLKKIPIAIPVFKAMYETEIENQIATEGANLLSDTLEFTGYFKILNREGFLEDIRKIGTTGQNIHFQNWISVGAEMLVTGLLSVKDENSLELELRLFDTLKVNDNDKLLIGKRYSGGKNDLRKMIHRFCSEILFLLTKSYGYFDTKMAFISTASGKKEVYMCDFDGQNIEQITRNNSITISPSWSSDGAWIAYTSYYKGKPDIYILNLKEKRVTNVTEKGSNLSPAWFPGRFALAASMSFSGDSEIYLLTGTGKIIKKLTNNLGVDVSPSFSPDGKKIAFVSDRAGGPQIYIFDLSSENTERLTFQGKYNTSPNWSPKGDKIAYSGMDNGEMNICVIGADGKGLTQLTSSQGKNEYPSWSPDGSLIAFNSTREGISRIYVMTAYGTDQRRLLTMPGEQTSPSWSPRVGD
ncbi:MAG: Tol-Pal system beta propeller repeat protein TolB [Desulfobacterales bacterium]|nr:Tol-Pal system beta propeller repeat protein TolB [Desulfobacterales bacterium]